MRNDGLSKGVTLIKGFFQDTKSFFDFQQYIEPSKTQSWVEDINNATLSQRSSQTFFREKSH